MGILDSARRKAERPLTDAAIDALKGLRPNLMPRGVVGMCPEGEAHYGVLAEWNDGAAIFIRCQPNWYVQKVSLEVGGQLSRAQHAGASLSYTMDAVSPGFTNPLAPAQIDPRTAAVHMASAMDSFIQESERAAAAQVAAAESEKAEESAARTQAENLQAMVNLEHVLQSVLPETYIERVSGGGVAGLRLGLGTTIKVDAWPLPDRWGVTFQTMGPDGPYRRSHELARDVSLTKVAAQMLLFLGQLGSRYVEADASGLHVRDDFDGHQGVYLRDYSRTLWVLARWSAREAGESDDVGVLVDVGMRMMRYLSQKRPDLYAWCEAHVNDLPPQGIH